MSHDVEWIKLTAGFFEDEKIDYILRSMPEADAILVIWIRLITMAGKCNANGFIYLTENIPYSMEDLANKFNKPINTIKLAITTFIRLEMIEDTEKGILLINWTKHQNIEGLEKIRNQTNLRVKKFRNKQKALLLGEKKENKKHETLRNVSSNVTETQSNETEQEQEQEQDLEQELEQDNKNNNREPKKEKPKVVVVAADKNNPEIKKKVQAIREFIKIAFTDKEIVELINTAAGDTEAIKIQYENSRHSTKPIKNLFTWMRAALKNNYKTAIPSHNKEQTGTFNNFEQRDYDYDDLEKKLLGWDKNTPKK
jgi:predicted phage replisome organizer